MRQRMNKQRWILIGFSVFCLLGTWMFAPQSVVALPGGIDSIGGHRDTKNGGYHVHQGTCAGQSFGSQADAIRAGGKR